MLTLHQLREYGTCFFSAAHGRLNLTSDVLEKENHKNAA